MIVGRDAALGRFDPADYDKLIFPFFDEAEATFQRLFKFGRQSEYKDWITKFRDPEEQKEIPPLDLKKDLVSVGSGGMKTLPAYMVEESTMAFVKQDPKHMFNLTLTTFNSRKEDLLYLGRLQLTTPIGFSKIEPTKRARPCSYSVKIQYFVRGMVPILQIKAFDSRSPEVLRYTTTNQKHIKMLIRICNQHSDRMILNQLQSVISVRTSKLTVGKSLYLNFNRKQLKNKNLDQ